MVSPDVLEKISSERYDESGRHCNYYRLEAGNGLKTYRNAHARDTAYFAQSICHRLGLAPSTGERFEMTVNRFGQTVTVYCFTTQHITPASEVRESDDDAYYTLRDEMHRRYRAANVSITDTLDFNWGVMPDDTPVMIDFGDVEFLGFEYKGSETQPVTPEDSENVYNYCLAILDAGSNI